MTNTKHHKILNQQNQNLRRGDVVLVARRGELYLGITEHQTGQFAWVRRRKNNHLVTERINYRKLHLLHRPFKGQNPPGADNHIQEIRRTRGRIQERVDRYDPDAPTAIILPYQVDDTILHGSYQYYHITQSGRVVIRQINN